MCPTLTRKSPKTQNPLKFEHLLFGQTADEAHAMWLKAPNHTNVTLPMSCHASSGQFKDELSQDDGAAASLVIF